jgi:SAM-dependent methyltransferase
MAINKPAKYDADPHVAEIYDTEWETEAPEVEEILGYIAGRGPRRILDPFCGTGRILLPLAEAGHELVGMDQCQGFLARLREKLSRLPEEVQHRVTLIEADSLAIPWPRGFDVVFMGGNCLWELATAEEQDRAVASAASALKRGGHLYLDNDIINGDLPGSWYEPPGFHWGTRYTCADGTRLEFGGQTIWYDAPRRLHRVRRIARVTSPDGQVTESEAILQTHATSLAEVRGWLAAHGFVPEVARETERRATYWARREG